MPTLISERLVKKSRKATTCDYCSEVIEKGSSYKDAFLKEGSDVYHWQTHTECDKVANELWDYINPWDGMTTDDFVYGVDDFYKEFLCSECAHKERCSLNSYDDCPCGIDGHETKKQVDRIKPILDEHYVRYHKWTKEEPYAKSVLVKKVEN